jgi:hypothetical protein
VAHFKVSGKVGCSRRTIVPGGADGAIKQVIEKVTADVRRQTGDAPSYRGKSASLTVVGYNTPWTF